MRIFPRPWDLYFDEFCEHLHADLDSQVGEKQKNEPRSALKITTARTEERREEKEERRTKRGETRKEKEERTEKREEKRIYNKRIYK